MNLDFFMSKIKLLIPTGLHTQSLNKLNKYE